MDTQPGMSHSVQAIFLHLPAYSAGGWGKEKGDHMKKEGSVRAEDVKICEICGKMIIGEYDWIQTRRRTKLYFCKGMKCRGKKHAS